MSTLQSLPGWVALLVALLAFGSALLAFVGSLGLWRLKNFYRRVHAPTLGTTLGLLLMVAATVIFFSVGEGRPALRALLIGVFISVTTPITLLLLVRAALARDQAEGSDVLADFSTQHKRSGPK